MAINISFNGATILKPGAYSKTEIDLGGGFPLSPTGLVAIFGESDQGAPGSAEPNIADNVFSPEQIPQIRAKYGSGPLVDAASFLFAPAADAAIPSGAQAIYIYKTNASLRAQATLANSYGTLQAQEYGIGGNRITYQNTVVAESPASETGSMAIVPVSHPSFALLAASTITNTGGSVITGDVGVYPGTAIVPGGWTLVGTSHSADLAAHNAQDNALAEYTADQALSATTIPSVLDGQTLSAGVYNFTSGAATLAASGAGTLTFNGTASDVFIVQTVSTLGTGAGGVATIALTGGALAKNVHFVVGSSATINTTPGNTFNGNITAQASITINGGIVNGNMAALSGAITISAASNVTAQTGTADTSNIAEGLTLVIAQNGLAPVSYLIPGSANIAALLVLLNAAFPGLLFTQNLSNEVVITMAPGSNLQRNGNGRNFEIMASSTALAAFGFIAGMYTAAIEPMDTIVLNQTRDLIQVSQTVGGNVVLMAGFTATGLDATSATIAIDANNVTLTVVGGAQAGINILAKSAFSAISQLVAAINLIPGWSAALGSILYGQLPISVLDQVSATNALSNTAGNKPARIKKDAYEVQQFFLQSAMVNLLNPATKGLPDASIAIALVGGVRGATATADITNALDKFTKIRVNSVVPLFSRDASADIADGLTDAASAYTILGIHQSVKTHLSLMSTTKKRSERQGYLSMKDTYANCKAQSQNLAYERIQLVIQDVRQVNGQGAIQWFQPWAFDCMLAGARGGSPIGEPLTFKNMNVAGIRQTAQPMSTPDANIVNDFDPDTMYDDAIQNNITFMEHPQTGGFRVVVDNTTYGKDGNWVLNRAHVLYAADVLAFDLRSQLENIYIGVKNTVKATEVKSVCESILATYVGQGITVSTSDAPNGFKSLVVNVNGNTITISVTVKLVEGIDFVLADITLQRAQSVA